MAAKYQHLLSDIAHQAQAEDAPCCAENVVQEILGCHARS